MIRFWKYQGAGNDFVLLDCTKELPPPNLSQLARYLCDRRCGVGADGLLLLLPSDRADFRMRIFNADGSEPAMCGNGLRPVCV
jgi:diaminopimelate epimerase